MYALNAEIRIRSRLVEGCGGSGAAWNPAYGIDLGGNLDVDPLLVDPATGDLHLQEGSPCIDAGDTEAVPDGIATDLDGNPRFMRTAVDMGCYEADGALSLGDPVPRPRVPGEYVFASPNPFNPSTTIRFGVPHASLVELAIYDLKGRLVRTLVSDHLGAGDSQTDWDGLDGAGRPVASGAYLIRVQGDGFVTTGRMVLIK